MMLKSNTQHKPEKYRKLNVTQICNVLKRNKAKQNHNDIGTKENKAQFLVYFKS